MKRRLPMDAFEYSESDVLYTPVSYTHLTLPTNSLV